ncbi:unnamed protein product [Callosobruchus maculatus]|uniref:Uncharacterized protein n=1 Tax=Callosobruchus maculatus TaxID=64391 RepID=A0A653BV01_CALMS|nr:unnamed protein product [Callosobruchus maculatus]
MGGKGAILVPILIRYSFCFKLKTLYFVVIKTSLSDPICHVFRKPGCWQYWHNVPMSAQLICCDLKSATGCRVQSTRWKKH